MNRSGWRAMTSLWRRGAGQDRLMHGRHRRVPGGLRLLHVGEELERIETRRAEHGAAARQRRGEAGDQPMNVEEGHHVEGAVALAKLEGGGDIVGRGPDIGVRQRHDLRPRGGARSVQDERDVVGLGGL